MRTRFLLAGALPLCMTVQACGGGGGGGVNTTPPPAPPPPPVVVAPPPPAPPPPAPPPPAPPPPPNYDTAEFDRSAGIAHANAFAAYDEGATGAGITVAIVDSGIDVDSPEFVGRIHSASQDVAGNRGVDDQTGHGTAVSAVIGAARDDVNIVGLAFDSTLLALRTDEPGSCTDPDGCSHLTSDMAAAIDIAVQNGARAINLSLGGSPAPPHLRAAIGRAANAGVVIVISAGNDSAPEPDPLARVAYTAEADGHVIIAGSVDTNDQISDFSNRAGAGQGQLHYLGALGEGVRSFDHQGTNFIFGGTSFSAPQIAAAVALLAEAFPNLSGAEIVELLYTSARDAGAPGDDSVYGQGILDLTEAFQPQGATSLAGSGEPVAATGNIVTSEPMGDATPTSAGAIILDGFDRAFVIDLAATIRRTRPPRSLAALDGPSGGEFLTPAGSGAIMAFSVIAGGSRARATPLALSREDAERARVAAGMVAARLDRATTVAFAFSESGDSVAARIAGRERPAFLVARSARGGIGFAHDPETSAAVRRIVGRTGIALFGERGDALSRRGEGIEAFDETWRRADYALAGVALDRRFGEMRLDAALSVLGEEETLLGARLGPAFGGARGATTIFVDLGVGWQPSALWSLGAELRRGWTFARGSNDVFRGGRLSTLAASAEISRFDVLTRRDRLSFRVAQPLRVEKGGVDLNLPVSYDYATGTPGYGQSFFNLAPHGRQIDVEAAYARPLAGGRLTGHLFYRREPGNFDAMPNDIGAAIRFTLGF